MENLLILKKSLNIQEIEISGGALYYDQIYNNCCLLNSVIMILIKNGIKIFKDSNNLDDSIVLYNYLKQKNVKLYELGEAQQDNILEDIVELFNINICLYDKINNILNVYKKKDIKNDYLKDIILYVGGHFNIGYVGLDKTLEEKLKIIKELNINIIEIEKEKK